MCGIVGIVRFDDLYVEEAFVIEMNRRLFKRGPDSEGYFFHKNYGLGHRRLSIIDLVTGDQPMLSRDRKQVVVFNGEIYNFKVLKEELKGKGCVFNTTSDTEVLLFGYREWGIETLLNKLEGMFSFALLDIEKDVLYVARDKFGEKPLYFKNDGNEFIFASELKAFGPSLDGLDIDLDGLNYFLSLSYIPAPFTIYSGIYKLEPGNFLSIRKGERVLSKPYFKLNEECTGGYPLDLEKAIDDLRNRVIRSVDQRMISDVSVGVFLSGGIDSSIVAGIMNKLSKEKIQTFTIGFHEKSYDESKRAQLVAKKIKSDHNVIFLDYKDVVNHVDEIINYFDEPFGDSSAIPSYFVARLAREKVKVVLTGDCADELFGGYEKYLAKYYSEKFEALPEPVKTLISYVIRFIPHNRVTNSMLRRMKKVINNKSLPPFDQHYNLMCLGFNDQERSRIVKKDWYLDIKPQIKSIYDSFNTDSDFCRGQLTDIRLVLEGDMFVKTDRVGMKNSLETRAPFIDTEILRFALSIPENYKINGRSKKWILKKTFKDLLPAATLRFRKKGFGVPVDLWMRKELRAALEELTQKEFISSQGIFEHGYLKTLIDEHISGRENHKGKLWNIYVFQKWYKRRLAEN